MLYRRKKTGSTSCRTLRPSCSSPPPSPSTRRPSPTSILWVTCRAYCASTPPRTIFTPTSAGWRKRRRVPSPPLCSPRWTTSPPSSILQEPPGTPRASIFRTGTQKERHRKEVRGRKKQKTERQTDRNETESKQDLDACKVERSFVCKMQSRTSCLTFCPACMLNHFSDFF